MFYGLVIAIVTTLKRTNTQRNNFDVWYWMKITNLQYINFLVILRNLFDIIDLTIVVNFINIHLSDIAFFHCLPNRHLPAQSRTLFFYPLIKRHKDPVAASVGHISLENAIKTCWHNPQPSYNSSYRNPWNYNSLVELS